MLDVLNFFCPCCGTKTTIKKEFQPLGKRKKCKGCDQVYTLNSDSMCRRVVSNVNSFNSTQIKPAATSKKISPTSRRVSPGLNSTQIRPSENKKFVSQAPVQVSSPITTRKIVKHNVHSIARNDAENVISTQEKISDHEKLDTTSQGKKIIIECPHCNQEYRIRVYLNLNRYRCTKTSKIFSLDEVKTMKIVDLKNALASPGKDVLPIFEESQIKEEKTIEVNLQDTTVRKTITMNSLDNYLKDDEKSNETVYDIKIDMNQLLHDNPKHNNLAKLLIEEKKTIGNKYQILGEAGTGGFGHVYMAFDKVLHRYVAIKLGANIDQQEAEKLARLNHPNIVQVYDFGIFENASYIVMEYVQGLNIYEYVQKIRSDKYKYNDEKITIQICRLLCELCDVLSYLHKNKIYHADIKPHNILVSNTHTIKLIDFGSKSSFTYKYAAPERFEGHIPSVKSDIYSLGGVFFELLTGSAPNTGNRVIDVIYNSTLAKQFPENSNVEQKLKDICLRCLDSTPASRYENVHELRVELMEYIAEKHKVNSVPHIYLDSIKMMLPLTKNKNYIGRALTNDIILDDENISRIHAVIHVNNDDISIENISKHYPLSISSERLLPGKKKELKQKEKIAIGQFRFTFVPKQGQEKVLVADDKSYTVQSSLNEEPIALQDDDFSDIFKKTDFGGWEINGGN